LLDKPLAFLFMPKHLNLEIATKLALFLEKRLLSKKKQVLLFQCRLFDFKYQTIP